MSWSSLQKIGPRDYTCGWCCRHVASEQGYHGEDRLWQQGVPNARWQTLVICPNCDRPTFFDAFHGQTPGVPIGDPVEYLPPDVEALYEEARKATAEGSNTAAVLAGRKLLMHVAVEKGAPENQSFAKHVTYLVENNVITADMRDWVDEIRELGNDANHEIVLMSDEDAGALMTFLGMLLRIAYEYPERAKLSMQARKSRAETPADSGDGGRGAGFDGGAR